MSQPANTIPTPYVITDDTMDYAATTSPTVSKVEWSRIPTIATARSDAMAFLIRVWLAARRKR